MAVNSISHQKTIQQIIDESSKSTSNRETGELGKDDFLNLLVTQLRYQDPLNPTEDKEFIGQMAQFSSLEQMQNMNSSFSSVKAFNLIGKSVTATITDEKNNTKTVEGEVTSVKMKSGEAFVVIKGQDISIDKITDVMDNTYSTGASIASYTNLIGFDAGGAVYDSNTGDLVGVNGEVKEIVKGVYEDYALMDGVKVTISDINSGTTSSDPNYRKNYLEAHKGEAVSVYIADRSRNVKVPVEAVLKDYNITPDGNITATLDKLSVPVESICNIKPAQQET